ncbi:conserved hypothetical protein [Sporisorium reilianum SRZ2]|uniref:GATA-type domain-containing protein n=1 Tax=Sporisorium reilianum (strain SRZ2) TaxID=999809 RepID=E6ZLC6_SPORE|nr:conserved hypothetical protein [Sporisorium reilianum SRZ2]
MSIGSDEPSSLGIQARPGPAAAGSSPSAPSTTTTNPEALPRTPTPPPLPATPQPSSQAQSQQQQIQQHQQAQASQNASQTSNSNVTTAPKAAAPTPLATASQPPPRPPPPASAVSLHAAAAAANKQQNAAQATDAKSAPPIAPKPSAQAPSSSQTQATPSATSTGAAPPKKQAKPKTNKAPGTAKPKQKRKANQTGANDELVYRPGPSTAGGTIGAAPDSTFPAMLTAAGGGRKALPELVLPFQLPFAEIRPEMPILDNASVHAAMAMGASETSSLDTGSDSDDYSVLSDDSDLDSEAEESRREARRRRREPATIEESLVLLQSLRQSRLSHLSSLLTPFSQRVRSGMIHPNVLPLSLLHGLNPRDPHVLIQLGRADIHVGPHVFLKTKFWEVRPDYEMPPVLTPMGGMRAPGSFGGPSVYPRMAIPQSIPPQLPLPQPQPPKLPSPRAVPAPTSAPALPQPSMPLAPTPTTANKSPVARPATGNASSATTPVASSLATSKPTGATTLPALPTPTLPATPIQSGLAARPAVTPKPAASVATPAPAFAATPISSAAVTTASTPAVAAATPVAKPVAAPATATPAAASQIPPTAAKPATPAPASTSGSGASTPSASITDGKQAAAAPAPSPAPVTLAPKPITVPVSLPRPPSINQNHSSSSASAASSSSSSNAAAQPSAPQKTPLPANASAASATAPAATAPAASAPSSNASTPSAAAPAAKSTGVPAAAAKPAAPANANASTSAPQAPPRPAGVPPPPAIDAVLVSRVNATAALNPELQELLHIAASGKANPNQLKALGVWIQAITAQLRQDEARNAAAANNAAGASGSRAGNAASTTAEGKKSKKTKVDEAAKASKKQAKIEEREAKKKAKAEAKAKAQADKQLAQKQQKEKQQMLQQQQQHHLHQQQHNPHQPPISNKLRHPPPGWPTDGPPKPPVIIVEFRENPSMRFILPLWKCLVERTEGIERPSLPKVKKERRSFFDNDSEDDESQRIEPELKLSFFAPSLGSDAADGSGLRELEEELKRKAAEEARLNGANGASCSTASPEAASQPASGDKSATEDAASASQGKKKKGGASAGSSKKGSSKAIKQEAQDVNMSSDASQSKKHEVYPLTWSIKGGVTESLWEAFGRVPGTMTCQPVKREPEIELEPDVAEFLVPEIRYHLLDLPMEEIKIQKETTETFVDLYSQMPDRRFILPRVAPALLPQGLEDHLQDRFAVRPQCVQGRPMVKRKAGAREDDVSFSYEGIGLTVIGPNGVKTEPGASPPKPPKRKRHVATHNSDGSIKSCGACGKTKTPMWRRGPKGPSQLCNACGARWKAGRLVVPEVAPPPIIEAEDEARKEDEAQASMHGSNALVIPQSSSADDGSYTVMASSGLVGAAAFGDPFSLTSEGKGGMDFGSSHLNRGSSSPSPFIRSPVAEDDVMPASVDPSMLSGSNRVFSRR